MNFSKNIYVKFGFTGLLLLCVLGIINTPTIASNTVSESPGTELWDNGPVITHPGSGFGGADVSATQTNLGLSFNGFNHQMSGSYRVADDFLVTSPQGWHIEGITFFAYQTGASISPSTITGVYYQVWDGPPNDPDSNIIWGDLTTNRLTSSTWSNIYRTVDTDLAAITRPIMTTTASAGLVLGPGTYWLDWASNGSLSSGPWVPPISILGQTTTGNALHYYSSAWTTATDTGTGTQQGMPFIINGSFIENTIYLPSIMNNVLLNIPVPTLNAIENADGNGKYTVGWSSVDEANSYTLQEDDNMAFSSPTEVYSGSLRSVSICCRDVGTYYYRVKASTSMADSAWSNIVSTVVTIPVPACPQTGSWTGWTTQGKQINFVVNNSPTCQIDSLDIGFTAQCQNGGSYGDRVYFSSIPIEYNDFTKYYFTYGLRVNGTFSSITSASGTWSVDFNHEVNGHCWGSGTWTAGLP